MTNPDLAAILRRFYALVAASVLPAGALLLSAGRPSVAFGLAFGAVIGVLNAAMLSLRINRAVSGGVAQAQRVMQQGMGIRFALITLAAVVAVKADPASIVGFLLGLGLAMAVAMAVAARALLATAGPRAAMSFPPATSRTARSLTPDPGLGPRI